MNKEFCMMLASAPLFMACQSEQLAKESTHPNIIYVLTDDLGYGDVQCLNPEGKIPTPNMNSMAANGMVFTNTYTTSAVSTPSRYSILTGRYSWRTTLKEAVLSGYSKSLIAPERATVASTLQSKGYTTAFIGKWHLGWDWDILAEDTDSTVTFLNKNPKVNFKTPIKNGPTAHGFDYAFGFCGSLDMAPYVWVENDAVVTQPTKITCNMDAKSFWRKGPTADDFNHTTVLTDVAQRAVDYIGTHAEQASPFFLYLPLPAPHTPILPQTEFLGKSNANMYADYVMEVDDVLRRIREVVKQKGISDNTMIVLTSDNGCSPKANYRELARVGHDPSYIFRGAKSDIYEGGSRVPFIVEWPAVVKAGSQCDSIVSTADFFATCAEMVQYETKANEGEDSYSFMPYLKQEAHINPREYIVLHSIYGQFAIRQGDWKLCLCPGSGGWGYPTSKQITEQHLDVPAMQLYNIKEDIGETTNLINKYPEKVKHLKAMMKKYLTEGRSTPGKAQANDEVASWPQIKPIVD